MSLPVPLQVRLDNGRAGRRDITRRVRDLEFRITAPGGYASVTLVLDAPLNAMPGDIGFYGKVLVTDKRTGRRVCEGYLEDPGRSAGEQGELYSLTAMGPSSHVHDRTVPLIYVDTSTQNFKRVDNTKPGMETAAGVVIPFNEPDVGVVLRLPQGITTNLGDSAGMRYSDIWFANQKVARVTYDVNAGGPNNNWFLECRLTTDGALSGDIGDSISMTAAGAGSSRQALVVTDFTLGRNTVDFLFDQQTGGTVTAANDLHWASFAQVVIRSVLVDKSGSDITTGYTGNHVFAHEVIADLLGRLLPLYDGPNAVLTTNFNQITQLAYPDGTDAGNVFDDLMRLENTCLWMVWESNAAGKHRFEWKSWPLTPRYVASTVDGYQSTESADELFNAARVRYVDTAGNVKWERRTLTVPELAALGRTRESLVDLGNETGGTAAQAQLAGDQFLLDHNQALNAGQLTVGRAILDRDTKRMVQPWEILPGYLIMVRGVQPRVDALNANPRATSTVFRIVDLAYQASSNTATLQLTSKRKTAALIITENKTEIKKRVRRRK